MNERPRFIEMDYFAGAEPVELADILDARERRACMQQELLRRYEMPLICFTLNIPGKFKLYPLVRRAFAEGKQVIERLLAESNVTIAYAAGSETKCGCEAFYCVDCPAGHLKRLMLSAEECHPLGRLLDIDVFDPHGQALHGEQHGRKERPCLICGKPVWACSRSRAHSAETLSLCTARFLRDYFANQYADKIGQLAVRALLYEVSVTPKPGLVDRCNSGSHTDMDFFTFVDSSCALIPYFRDITRAALLFSGKPENLLESLRPLGLLAEEAMRTHTGGVNTHKGLIYSMGILCAALGRLRQAGAIPHAEQLFDMCACIAGKSQKETETKLCQPKTNGQVIFAQYQISGIRGETARGFPNVRDHSLPVMMDMIRQGFALNDAGVVALLHLIAHVDDTNMIHRSNLMRSKQIQEEMRRLLEAQHDRASLIALVHSLDTAFITEHLSPGGCADLLAITFMVYFVLAAC